MQATEDYGRILVEMEKETSGFNSTTPVYYVKYSGENEAVEIGHGKDGKKLARTLAATLDKAGVTGISDVLPPEFGPSKYDRDGGEWEQWAGESQAIPAQVAAAGKAAMAGWLKVVHQEREGWIATELGVSEPTVRQYLSDLREGRR